MMQSSFNDAINLRREAANEEREMALIAIAGISASKIPGDKKPVSAELLGKMQQHYHKLKKKHPLWNDQRLQKATAGYFNVEIINDAKPTDAG